MKTNPNCRAFPSAWNLIEKEPAEDFQYLVYGKDGHGDDLFAIGYYSEGSWEAHGMSEKEITHWAVLSRP